ncbi:MAG: hypothetical protein OXC00_04735 [Acidimicrobiaceae bacterium]|nr:hypothetical protein [Acidimicrobiaceae bacterium]
MSKANRSGRPSPDQPPRQRTSLRIRVSIAALAVLGILGLVVAALVGSGDDDADSAVTASPAVNRVIPSPGDEVLQQQRVGVVLDARYRLSSLVVYQSEQLTGGGDVTAEVNHIEGLNRFEFVPGEGRLIEALSPDTNCVVATFVLIARPEEADTVRWCFEVS